MQVKNFSEILSKKIILLIVGFCLFVFALILQSPGKAEAAACVEPSPSFGKVTFSSANSPANPVNIPASGSYRIWVRVQVPSSTANSFFLEIDNTTCFKVQPVSSAPTNTWIWVNYTDGNAASFMDTASTFAAGNHNVELIGNAAGVMVDRVIFTQDKDPNSSTCNANMGLGDSCASVADPAPTVSISAPANNAAVSATTNITTNVSADTVRVEFFVDGNKVGEDTTSPYTYSWNTTTIANGSHTLTAKAWDASNQSTTSAGVTVNVSNTTSSGADLVVTNVTWAPTNPGVGQEVTFSVTVKNQGTAATSKGPGVRFVVDNDFGTVTWVDKDSTPVLAAGESKTFTANGGAGGKATWTAVSGNHNVEAYVDDLNEISESNDNNNILTASMSVGTTPPPPPPSTFIPEDINEDRKVNLTDFGIFRNDFGKCSNLTNPRSNINSSPDGCVNLTDFGLFRVKFGLIY